MPTEIAYRADSYFVCATPRTGSSLLLGLLNSTEVCGHPQAYFRAPDERLWADRWQIPRTAEGGFNYADYAQAARAAGSTPNGVFGAKLMWGTLDEVVDKLGAIHRDLAGDDVALLNRAFGRTRFIYLRRHDVLAQAVSWLRAEQTNTWFIGGNGEISGNSGNRQAPRFDAGAIRRFMDMIEEHNAAWEAWFASWGIQPYRVTYEHLDDDMVITTRGILEFLGIDAPDRASAIAARHRRQADGLNQQWIEQYQAQVPDN
ncbi:Stf0 family sulfotransferase [Dactylosporangium sp. NPDC051485]|uniref:Stf0 family sulfotransferase n=1 Tax=Dactylosporangium sp. NPDC051485 TaxID=3154846 RepID=UPI00343C380F